jgi:hypothetical protein
VAQRIFSGAAATLSARWRVKDRCWTCTDTIHPRLKVFENTPTQSFGILPAAVEIDTGTWHSPFNPTLLVISDARGSGRESLIEWLLVFDGHTPFRILRFHRKYKGRCPAELHVLIERERSRISGPCYTLIGRPSVVGYQG